MHLPIHDRLIASGRPLRPATDRLQQRSGNRAGDTGQHGKASTPTPIFDGKVYTKCRSTTMRGRTYVVRGVAAMCVSANEAICMHAAPWQEDAGQAFGIPRSNGCVRMPIAHARWLFNTPTGTPIRIQA